MVGCCRALGIALLALFAVPLRYQFFPPKVHEVSGKCALVTGASAGTGVHIARRLAAEGVSKMIIAARSKDKLDAVVRNISVTHPSTKVVAVKADVSKDDDITALVAAAMGLFGEGCPIILVNNAGIMPIRHAERFSFAEVDHLMDVNYKGLLHLTLALLPSMYKSHGHIVNVASVSGKMSLNGMSVYSATKHAIVGFSSALRLEIAYRGLNVSVHRVLPGLIYDEGVAVDRSREAGADMSLCVNTIGGCYPEEVADAVVRAVQYDDPEVWVNTPPILWLAAVLLNAFPRLYDLWPLVPIPWAKGPMIWMHALAEGALP